MGGYLLHLRLGYLPEAAEVANEEPQKVAESQKDVFPLAPQAYLDCIQEDP